MSHRRKLKIKLKRSKPAPEPSAQTKPIPALQQRLVLASLSSSAAALLLGMSARNLRKCKPPPPRNVDGSYPGPALVAWFVARESQDDPLLTGDGDSLHLDRYRSAKASLAELELGERTGRLVDMDELHAWWITEIAAPIRKAIETLASRYGAEAAAVVATALEKGDSAMEARAPEKCS